MGATPSHENDGDDVAGTDSDDDDDIIKIQPNARYRVSKMNFLPFFRNVFCNNFYIVVRLAAQKGEAHTPELLQCKMVDFSKDFFRSTEPKKW